MRFPEVLATLQRTTGRCEASFASKLVATIDPNMPVIDSIVLRNLALRLPSTGFKGRLAAIQELHRRLETHFTQFLTTSTGRYLVERFREEYPTANITTIKMLDLVLWQTRSRNAVGTKPTA